MSLMEIYETASYLNTSKNCDNYWNVDFQIDIFGETCCTAGAHCERYSLHSTGLLHAYMYMCVAYMYSMHARLASHAIIATYKFL